MFTLCVSAQEDKIEKKLLKKQNYHNTLIQVKTLDLLKR
jgi:hypothetical protein